MQKHLEIWSATRFTVTVKRSSSKPTASNACGQNLCTVLAVSMEQIRNCPIASLNGGNAAERGKVLSNLWFSLGRN